MEELTTVSQLSVNVNIAVKVNPKKQAKSYCITQVFLGKKIDVTDLLHHLRHVSFIDYIISVVCRSMDVIYGFAT